MTVDPPLESVVLAFKFARLMAPSDDVTGPLSVTLVASTKAKPLSSESVIETAREVPSGTVSVKLYVTISPMTAWVFVLLALTISVLTNCLARLGAINRVVARSERLLPGISTSGPASPLLNRNKSA